MILIETGGGGSAERGVLRGLLAQAGIEHEAVAITHLLPDERDFKNGLTRNKSEAIPGLPPPERGYWFPASSAPHLARVQSVIDRHQPNLVVAMGTGALWALTRMTGIARWRGSPVLAGSLKVLPTWSPSSIIKQWELRAITLMDLHKAKREAESPLLVRPRRIIYLDPTLEDLETFWREHIEPAPFVALDTETKAGTITEVGFATSASVALVVPFWSRKRGSYWPTPEAEAKAWAFVRRVCVTKPLVGQNFQYDMNYLWRTIGIPCPGFVGDTMLLHHALQPELKKSLGFLGSIYTDEPSWKFMRTDHSTMKREDE
jgi:hypothetical protein